VLDSSLAGGDEHFWQEVAAENMEGDEEEYGRLVVEEREIWKNLLKNYNNIHENWTLSGNHDDF
jgi:hypothetical protein